MNHNEISLLEALKNAHDELAKLGGNPKDTARRDELFRVNKVFQVDFPLVVKLVAVKDRALTETGVFGFVDKEFVLSNMNTQKTFRAHRSGMNYYTLDNGKDVHIYNVSVVSGIMTR